MPIALADIGRDQEITFHPVDYIACNGYRIPFSQNKLSLFQKANGSKPYKRAASGAEYARFDQTAVRRHPGEVDNL